jgi:hypothetical protein
MTIRHAKEPPRRNMVVGKQSVLIGNFHADAAPAGGTRMTVQQATDNPHQSSGKLARDGVQPDTG